MSRAARADQLDDGALGPDVGLGDQIDEALVPDGVDGPVGLAEDLAAGPGGLGGEVGDG